MEMPNDITIPEPKRVYLNTLRIDNTNPNVMSDANFEALKLNIKRFGFIIPIITNEDYVIADGYHRWKAARELGMSEVLVIKLPLKDVDRRMLRQILNKLRGNHDSDKDLIEYNFFDESGVLDEMEQLLPDFSVNIDSMNADVEEDDFVPDIDKPPKYDINKGDVYTLGNHRLMCGDSTDKADVDLLMDGDKADMVFTDPPYGIDADKMTMGSGAKEFHRGNWDNERPDITFILDLAEKICIWGGNYFADILPATNDWLCWHKKNDGLSFSEFELAWTNFDKNCRHLSHHWGNEKKQHVTMKPVQVCAWGISLVDGVSVLDLFGGSGSTLIACEQLNRKCYMMELDPKYCSVIIERWEALTGKEAQNLGE